MENKLSDQEVSKIKAVQQLRKFLVEESDRGCCLLAVSFLDNELKLLLKEKLVGTKKEKEKLFNLNGPLGNFSSKIDLGFSIGLINPALKTDIHIIRKIRNDFSHKYDPIDFNTKGIKNSIQQLKHNLYEKDECSSREMFINAVTLILAEINEIFAMYLKFQVMENKKYLDIPAFTDMVKRGIDKIYSE